MTLAPTQAPTQGAPSRVRRWILPALALALVVACAAGIAIGAYGVGLGDVWDGIAGRLTGRSGDVADAVVVGSRIIEEIEKSSADDVCARVKILVADLRRGIDDATKA